MQKIKLKIPKRQNTKNAELSSSVIKDFIPELEFYQFEELIEERDNSNEFVDFGQFFNDFGAEISNVKSSSKNKKKVDRPSYALYFTIGNFNKLCEIDLSKINKIELTTEEIQNQVQSAYDKGFEDGKQITQMALAEEVHKMESWVRRIDEVVLNLQQEFSQRIRSVKDIIIPLAIKISEHIIKEEIKANPTIVEKQVVKALEVIDNEKIFELRLNPYDIEILKNVNSALLLEPKLEGVEIIPDPSIEPGGCILETEVGKIDATINSQLAKILNALSNVSFDLEDNV